MSTKLDEIIGALNATIAEQFEEGNYALNEAQARAILAPLVADSERLDWLERQLSSSFLPLAHYGTMSQLDHWNGKNFHPSKPYAVGDMDIHWGSDLRNAIDAARASRSVSTEGDSPKEAT